MAEESAAGPSAAGAPHTDIQAGAPNSAAHRGGAWRRLLPILLIVGLAWAGVVWLDREEHTPGLVGEEAPPLAITAFDGAPIRLADLRGQGVVLNFWASWCEPCRVEAPIFEDAWRGEAARARTQGDAPEVVFVGVAMLDTPDAARAFIQEYDITYPNGPDTDARWDRRFGVNGVPTTFFIAPGGTVESVAMGPITSARALERRLDAIRPAARAE